jgi:hypothetical protein
VGGSLVDAVYEDALVGVREEDEGSGEGGEGTQMYVWAWAWLARSERRRVVGAITKMDMGGWRYTAGRSRLG